MALIGGGLRQRAYSGLLNAFFPSKCPVCGGASDTFRTSPICSNCWAEGIKPYDGPACSVCMAPFQSEQGTICSECRKGPPYYTRALSFGLYSGTLREAIHLLKFSSIRRLARPLGLLMAGLDLPRVDLIVPVPMGGSGLKERGFNQSALIGMAVSDKIGASLKVDVLLKKKDTLPQVGLSRAERLRNVKGAFGVRGNLNGERVLLIDDVMTTGATVRECSKVLIKAGAGEVFVATVARSG